MTQSCQTSMARDIERRWRPALNFTAPVPRNDNQAGSGHCPSCHAAGLLAPAASEYRGNGLIHHHWLCRCCGHEWVSVLHVSS
jgi:hypothetical protein